MIIFCDRVIQYIGMKSVAKSDKYRKVGNELFVKRLLRPALDAYGKSLLHAPISSESYAYAFGNRSAVLYEIGAHSECLRDIERALSCPSCPPALKEKLVRRKANCSSTKTAASKISVSAISKYDNNKIPELWKGSNTDISSISGQIAMDYHPECGRRLVALEDIPAGSVLIVEKPYSSVLLDHTLTSHCQYCHEILPLDYIPCAHCAEVRFCSEDCYERTTHELECGEVQRLMEGGLGYLAYKIFIDSSVSELAGYVTCPHRFLQQNKMHEGAYGLRKGQRYDGGLDCVLNLMSHHEDVDPADVKVFEKSAESLTRLASSRTQWPRIVDDLVRLSSNICDKCRSASKLQKQELISSFLMSLFLRLVEILICNAHAIGSIVKYEQGECDADGPIEKLGELKIASAVYPGASLMNHSCRPNIFSSFMGKTQIVRASRAIAAGEEILNCYGPQFGRMLTSARKQALKQQYYFDCVCSGCTQPEYLEREAYFTAFACTKCQTSNASYKSSMKEHALPCAMLKDENDSEFVCKECNFRTTVSAALKELDEVEAKLDIALQKTTGWDGSPVPPMCKEYKDVIQSFDVLNKLLYVHNKTLSEWRDKVAKWLLREGHAEESLTFVQMNLPTIEYIYGGESIELANEAMKIFDTLSITVPVTPKSSFFAEYNRRSSLDCLLEKTKRIFAIHYGQNCAQIKELNEICTLG